MSDARHYNELFDYLSAPAAPQEQHGVLAFGRNDLLVARKVVDLSRDRFSKYVVFTGSNKGKDSGNLRELGISEAEYLAGGAKEIAAREGVVLPDVRVETEATNGGENVRNSLQLMRSNGLPYNAGLISVAHATSLRRLTATIEHETKVAGETVEALYRVPTDYKFDPENPTDREEALDEMWRLYDWPTRGLLQPQADLPQDLVDFTIDQRNRNN